MAIGVEGGRGLDAYLNGMNGERGKGNPLKNLDTFVPSRKYGSNMNVMTQK
jgi:hypothetical protein